MAIEIDVPTALRDWVLDASNRIGLYDFYALAEDRHNCYTALVGAYLGLPASGGKDRLLDEVGRFFPNGSSYVAQLRRITAIDPRGINRSRAVTDVPTLAGRYASSIDVPFSTVVSVKQLDGVLTGARTLRILSSSFATNERILESFLHQARQRGSFAHLISSSTIAAEFVGALARATMQTAGVGLDVRSAIHRQYFQIAHGVCASTILTGGPDTRFDALLSILEAGSLPLGFEDTRLITYQLG